MKNLVKWLCMAVVATTAIGGEAQAQPEATPRELRLADFSRMSREEGESISFVDREGTVREGVLIGCASTALPGSNGGG